MYSLNGRKDKIINEFSVVSSLVQLCGILSYKQATNWNHKIICYRVLLDKPIDHFAFFGIDLFNFLKEQFLKKSSRTDKGRHFTRLPD